MLHFQSHPSSVSQESLVSDPPPGSPYIRPLWRELPISRDFFYMSLRFHNKSSDRKMSESLERSIPSMFPKMGPQWKEMPVSRTLPDTSFRVHSKGALPPGSPCRAHAERERLHFQTSSSFVSQSHW